jgi:hypothetical protein
MAESLKSGAIECFRKPFQIAQIKDSIKNHVLR